MKTEVRIYAAVALLAALGGAFWMTTKDEKAEREARSTSVTKQDLPKIGLAKEDVEKLTKIEIVNAEKGKVVLEKSGETWALTEPTAAKANQADIRSLLDSLEDLKIKEAIDRGTGQYEAYELADKKAVHLTAYNGSDKALDLYFGKSGTRGQMMRIEGKDGVYAADGYQSFLFTKEAKNWRDKALLKFEDKEATKVVVDNVHARYTFDKKGDAWTGSLEKKNDKGETKSAKWEKFDPKKVEDLLRAYKGLNAVDFAEKDAQTGLDDAAKEGGIVTVTAKGESYSVKVGKTQKGSNRFAVKDGGDGTIVVVSSWAADWAVAEPAKFEKKDDKKDKKGDDKDDAESLEMPGMPGMPGMPDLPDLGGDD